MLAAAALMLSLYWDVVCGSAAAVLPSDRRGAQWSHSTLRTKGRRRRRRRSHQRRARSSGRGLGRQNYREPQRSRPGLVYLRHPCSAPAPAQMGARVLRATQLHGPSLVRSLSADDFTIVGNDEPIDGAASAAQALALTRRQLQAELGTCSHFDINGDDVINVPDLLALLSNYGCCWCVPQNPCLSEYLLTYDSTRTLTHRTLHRIHVNLLAVATAVLVATRTPMGLSTWLMYWHFWPGSTSGALKLQTNRRRQAS
eukprot:SAG31_NODE_614_length_13525_cov_4.312230_9_plen_256_part_00